MRSFPSLYPQDPKVCSACGATVARRDCHKNRFGEYICRVCQAAGIKVAPGRKLQRGSRRAAWGFWVGLLGLAAAGLLAWIGYALFMHIDLFRFFLPAVAGETSAAYFTPADLR